MSIELRSIKSAERTLSLLELFSQRETGLTVGDTARSLAIPQPSASMLLRNLMRLGYLDYDRETRLFSPTIRVMLLGSWISRRFSEASSIALRLEALQEAVGETVYAAIQNGAAIQYVVKVEVDLPDRLRIDSGALRSITCSASGRMLLSLKPDREVSGWLRRSNAETTEPRLQVRETEFLERMKQIRAQGYADTNGDSDPELAAVAVSVQSPMGRMPLAIGVGGPISRIREKKDALITALFELQSEFGHPTANPEPVTTDYMRNIGKLG
jgi:DNA-binding IclR family transcriptional regulator